ncbi:uncharacterized protein LOC122266954 [Penaeus japonicus]|uniref:uncharacterized protein LOC122264318 n=1 Tax=Penaeus japonicus TaxID=27405 RepID=UPI001C71525F|nr:uncharacterized protein LOC122264318 [Penaeus japonicus]XP_042892879.1 uncharacterized protein LOC122266954 [Penaeus japonicus]
MQNTTVLQLFPSLEFTKQIASTVPSISTMMDDETTSADGLTTYPGLEKGAQEGGDLWPTWINLMPGVLLLSLTVGVVCFMARKSKEMRSRIYYRPVEAIASTPLLHRCKHTTACDCEDDLVRYGRCPV